MKFLSLVLLFAGFLLAPLAEGAPLTFGGYFRSTGGSNLKGGQQECYNNPGSFGNEFRIGNECGMYGEASFASDLTDKEKWPDVYSKAYLTFSYVYDNRTDFEQSANNWVIRAAYVEIGVEKDMPGVFWVGKRFYRWGDVSAIDFYPVSMNGSGAGYGGFKKGPGVWSFGVIQSSESKELNGSATVITTENKIASKTTFHVRWEEVELSEKNKLHFWLTGATTPATKSTPYPGTDYKSGTGGFLAMKETFAGASPNGKKLTNELGLAYGQGVMSGMGANGELVKDCSNTKDAACTVQNSERFRIWNGLLTEQDLWSGQLSLVYDDFNKKTSTDNKVRWLSVAVEPIFYLTDHVHWISVLGLSNVLNDSDGLGTRTLSQITVGPQLTVGRGFYSRPVLRLLYAARWWNRNNESSFATTSAAGKDDAQSLQAQVEVWF